MKFTTIPTTIDYQMLSLSKTNHAHIINVAKINEPPFQCYERMQANFI